VFYGRQAELNLVDKVLSPLLKGIIRHRAFCIPGIGVVRKSRMAQTDASRFRNDFDAIFVIRSEKDLAVSRKFTSIARKLGLREQEEDGNADKDKELAQQWVPESGL